MTLPPWWKSLVGGLVQGLTPPPPMLVVSKEFFLRYSASEKVFPFLEFFEIQLKAEWAKRTSNKQFPNFVKKQDLPPFVTDITGTTR